MSFSILRENFLLKPENRPKLIFMVAGFISFLLSVSLWFSGNEMQGIFVGIWVPSIHSLGTLVLTNSGQNNECNLAICYWNIGFYNYRLGFASGRL